MWDVIIYQFANFNSDSVKPPFELGLGWVMDTQWDLIAGEHELYGLSSHWFTNKGWSKEAHSLTYFCYCSWYKYNTVSI